MKARRAKRNTEKAPAALAAPRFRFIPPGTSGQDLADGRFERLRPRAIWLRGEQRVRIRAVTAETVTFAELSHGRAPRRHLSRAAFLLSSSPE